MAITSLPGSSSTEFLGSSELEPIDLKNRKWTKPKYEAERAKPSGAKSKSGGAAGSGGMLMPPQLARPNVTTEDMKALWVVECKSKCKEAAQYYPPVPKNRHSYELPISKRSKLTKLEQDTVSHVSLHNGGDGVGEENGEGSSEIVYSI